MCAADDAAAVGLAPQELSAPPYARGTGKYLCKPPSECAVRLGVAMAMIFYFGAEFTRVHADARRSRAQRNAAKPQRTRTGR